jgi:micrococcal nuclease
LLTEGTDVWVERDVESRDRYGRLLGYLHRSADDLFVNLDLVAGGWALPYPFPPNTTFETRFAEAANEARMSSLGLWGRCSR